MTRPMVGRMGMGIGPGIGARAHAGVTTPAWTPLSLGTDLIAYWDAESAASVTLAGSLVTSWADQVAGLAAVQATSGFRPVYSATSLNGRPALTFDGTDDCLIAAAYPANMPTGTAGGEIWALTSQNHPGTQTSAQVLAAYGASNNTAGRSIRRANVGNVNRGEAVVNVVVDETTIDFSGIHVVRGTFSATTAGVSVDNSAQVTNAQVPATATTGVVAIGSVTTGAARFWKGPVNAVVYTNPLSAPNAALLLAFLKGRGGIA